MGDANPAQPYMVAGRESMNVETLAYPRFAGACHEPRLRGAEILHGGHLDVGRFAFEHIGWRARPFGDGDVVGQAVDASGGGAPVCGEDQRKGERLRRLHGSQRRAWRRRQHPAVGVHLLDGVAHRRPGRSSAMEFGRLDGAGDEIARGKRPSGVVDEHDVRRRRNERLKPGENALLAGFAAHHRWAKNGRSGWRRGAPSLRHRAPGRRDG